MSRSKVMALYGKEHGDKLYKRFHTMRTKAAQAGVRFYWESFSDYWFDISPLLPEDYHPSTHRVKFNLSGPQGYCKETIEIRRTTTKGDSPAVMSQVVERMISNPELFPEELRNKLVEGINHVSSKKTVKQEAISWAVDMVINTIDKLDSGVVKFDESFIDQ